MCKADLCLLYWLQAAFSAVGLTSLCGCLQISDNAALFQPLEESDIYMANSGEIINNRVWGNQVWHCMATFRATDVLLFPRGLIPGAYTLLPRE